MVNALSLSKLNIKNKMFCCRIYESDGCDKLEEDEHMHYFVLYDLNNKVYQIEHQNWEKIGIYEYQSEEIALNEIVNYYVQKNGGMERFTTEFDTVPANLSFQQFNRYINNLGKQLKYQK